MKIKLCDLTEHGNTAIGNRDVRMAFLEAAKDTAGRLGFATAGMPERFFAWRRTSGFAVKLVPNLAATDE